MRNRKDIVESVITYLTYDQKSNKKWFSPFCKKTHDEIRNDAEKIVELVFSDLDWVCKKCYKESRNPNSSMCGSCSLNREMN